MLNLKQEGLCTVVTENAVGEYLFCGVNFLGIQFDCLFAKYLTFYNSFDGSFIFHDKHTKLFVISYIFEKITERNTSMPCFTDF